MKTAKQPACSALNGMPGVRNPGRGDSDEYAAPELHAALM